MNAEWDVFICHAGEDKDKVVEPLAQELRNRGLRVWYDRWVLLIGDSLNRKIDEGLSMSRYGIVILSPHFFQKHWPRRELDGLLQREMEGQKIILPVWHEVTHDDVASFSLPLADKVGGSTSHGIPQLVEELMRAMTDPETEAVEYTTSSIPDVETPALREKFPHASRFIGC